MTFSAIGRCPRTGQLGMSIATFSVNSGRITPIHTGLLPWSGRGAMVLVHSYANPTLGWAACRLFDEGRDVAQVMAELPGHDPHYTYRQVVVMDQEGRIEAVTGADCWKPWAGHVVEDGWSVSGNALAGPGVVEAMAEHMRDSGELDLGDRLVGALEAGRAAGGQRDAHADRGVTELSSAVFVIDPQLNYPAVDLRVDYDPLAVPRLRALYDYVRPIDHYYVAMEHHPHEFRQYLKQQRVYDDAPHFREFREPKPLGLEGNGSR